MRIIETKVYKFEELSEEAREKAIEGLYRVNVDYEWWDFDDIRKIGKLMGIEISNIYFSGFSSQGDGACFEGNYVYKTSSVHLLKDYAPKDEALHRIATDLFEIQRKNFYGLEAHVKHRGHYYHELCTDIDVYHGEDRALTEDAEDAVKELLRDLMQWLYRTLEKEHDYLTGEEAIIETIKVNEYEFTEGGKLF